MVEFIRRLFAAYNVYGMITCAIFLGAWFYVSREQETDTLDPLERRRHRQKGPSVDQSL